MYKRQAHADELNWVQTIRLKAPIYPVIVYAEDIDESVALHALHSGAHDYVLVSYPVSYTQLDVYKRQHLDRLATPSAKL